MASGGNSSWKSIGWSSSSAISISIGNLRAHLLKPRRPAEHAQRRKFSREQHLRITAVSGGVKKSGLGQGRRCLFDMEDLPGLELRRGWALEHNSTATACLDSVPHPLYRVALFATHGSSSGPSVTQVVG